MQSLIKDENSIIFVRKQKGIINGLEILNTGIRSGQLLRLGRGSFIPAHHYHSLNELEQYTVWIKAVAADYAQYAMVGNSAAILHNLWFHNSRPFRVEIHRRTTLFRKRTTAPLHLYNVRVTPDEIEVLGGVKVTNIARTILDIFRIHDAHSAFVTLSHALATNRVTLAELEQAANQCTWLDHLHEYDQLIKEIRYPFATKEEALAYSHAHIELEEKFF
ncbi:hypothetical protein [Corynebacterium sp. sy039]|uniref:hypothetical protein n=1 Tax=Corynebacterium sp. sy039 TaxID=2599641 RepID=UPI0011B69785|nr:hypothetical protein [Corynebacterium sp. sy039]QDZ42757.1 hypothetical protein FQV43_06000 [Corynebacterium sp. sy039]